VALIVCARDKSAHDRAGFKCGDLDRDEFLRTKAAKHQQWSSFAATRVEGWGSAHANAFRKCFSIIVG
jgi:hypothetical protein